MPADPQYSISDRHAHFTISASDLSKVHYIASSDREGRYVFAIDGSEAAYAGAQSSQEDQTAETEARQLLDQINRRIDDLNSRAERLLYSLTRGEAR